MQVIYVDDCPDCGCGVAMPTRRSVRAPEIGCVRPDCACHQPTEDETA